ncbi:MAG TPA: tetratricopeptide repeat protein, partial [Pyrinomonadaceae bacterium]|nr:tetratricopeptide repeat protein [Pyrinomonadaceae bacterium]
ERLAKRGTDNPEAYDAYMRGRYHWNTFSEDGLAKALVSYSRAVALDPDYALAHAGIADYYNLLGVYTVLPTAETSAAAKEAALRAVALDSSLSEGYAALGFATLMNEFDWETAAAHLRRSIELNPNYVTGRLWYSYFLGMTGQFDSAIAEARRALELAPLTAFVRHTLSWAFYHAGRYSEAEVAARKLAVDEPRYGLAHLFLCSVLRHTGAFDEAVEAGRRAVKLIGRSPYTLCWLASAYASAGQRDEAFTLLDEVRDMSSVRYVSPYLLAAVHANLGDRDRALAELDSALQIGDGRLAWLGVDPQFDPMRGEADFEDLLQRTGNPIVHTRTTAAPPHPPAPAPAEDRRTRVAEMPPPGHSSDLPHRSADPSSRGDERMTDDEEAHKLYVAGRYFATRRTADGLRQAVTRFERAVERDPTFALAYAEMADCYALLNWYVEPPPAGAWARAREAALKAVEADDTLAEAHASLGFVLCHYDRDWPRAEAEFRRAIELKPDNPVARRWHALNLSAMGRHGEAVAEIRRAQVVSPRSPVIATAVAIVLFYAQRYDEAVEQCLRALEIDPGSLATHIVLRWSYEAQGMCEEALAIFEQEAAYAGDTPTTRAKHAHVLAACGRADEARSILRGLIERRDEQWVTAYEIAVVYSLLGERDEAFAWLARAEEEHAVGLTYIRVDPRINELRSDPRFVELLRRANDPRARLGDDATGEPHSGSRTVAVLPFKFVNPSPSEDTGDAYLGVGLADALITRLSNIRSLSVRPTSAVVRFRHPDTDPSEAGRALGVRLVLDGRVLRAGKALRVTVQLVRVGGRAPVWAEKFDEEESDILRLQDSISEKVAAALVPRLTEGERARVVAHGTDNPRAYEAVLRGRYHLNTPDEDGLARAHAAFSDAVALDPSYALAYAGLADYYNWLGVYGVRPSAECFAEAKRAAAKAVELDPELAEGYAALNFVAVGLDWDWAEAERLIKKSIELNPSYATAHNFYCIQLGAEGRFEEMELAGLRGLESDPLSAHLHQSIGWGFYHARRYEDALRHLDRSLELDPNFVMARWVKGWTLAQTGAHAEAVAELERAVLLTDRQSVPILAGLATTHALAGNAWEALNILAELQKTAARRHVSPYHLALITNVIGEQERALAHLEAAHAQREAWLIWLRGEPLFDSLRSNPRFRGILDSVHPPRREG